MALHSHDAVTVSAAVAMRSRADCSMYQPKHSPSFNSLKLVSGICHTELNE